MTHRFLGAIERSLSCWPKSAGITAVNSSPEVTLTSGDWIQR